MKRRSVMTRRRFMTAVGASSAATVFWRASSGLLATASQGAKRGPIFEVTKTESEWRSLLTPQQFKILLQADTEAPNSSPLNKEHRPGTFSCAGCALPLFTSDTKFESGTGWPSFYAPMDNAVRTADDRSLGMDRTEVLCRRCGGHLGHVFDDGPRPTGKRYCMNGAAMTFQARAAKDDQP